MSKSDSQGPIHDGEAPTKVLRDRGLEYDGESFLPQVPDILGYIIGLMLVWLVYTGYTSVRTLYQDSSAKVAKLGERAMEASRNASESLELEQKTQRVLDTLNGVSTSTAKRANSPTGEGFERAQLSNGLSTVDEEVVEGSWTFRQLDKFNRNINRWTSNLTGFLNDEIDDSDKPVEIILEEPDNGSNNGSNNSYRAF